MFFVCIIIFFVLGETGNPSAAPFLDISSKVNFENNCLLELGQPHSTIEKSIVKIVFLIAELDCVSYIT